VQRTGTLLNSRRSARRETRPKTGRTPAVDCATYIHYQPERVEYAVSEGELTALCEHTNNVWKDFCIACTSVGIPCLINTMVAAVRTNPFTVTLEFNLNALFGVVGLILGLAFGIAWWRTHRSAARVAAAIKAKPKMRLA
jgi:hypothetical protein